MDEVPVKSITILEFLMSGGIIGNIILLILFVLSLIAVFIFINKYLQIQAAEKIHPDFKTHLLNLLNENKIQEAIDYCHSKESILAKMLAKTFAKTGTDKNDLQAVIENIGKLEISNLENNIANLATIAGGAPMLGFLGTVIGMIMAFYNISFSMGDVRIETLSEGIYTAMITTAVGLVVGIFAYFTYNFLVTRVKKLITKLESEVLDFVYAIENPQMNK